jgi:DNA-binding GntR family transcriptional regulator
MSKDQNLTVMTYNRIKEMMFDYHIVPGQRLVFMDLAKQLGVSRTPVNNALSILGREGFLDFVPNQGFSVHRLTQREAESLYEIRELIELGTVAKAVRMLTPPKLAELKKSKEAYEKAVNERVTRQLFILDTEFHVGIISMIDNVYLPDRYREVCQHLFLRHRVENLRLDRIREIISEHNELFGAIQTRDVELAKDLIKTHNKHAREKLFAILFGEEHRLERP